MHLHVVDIQYPFAFFVHNCEPQSEAPRPNIQSNEKLPKLISDIVMKGLNATSKINIQQNNFISNDMLRDNEKKTPLMSMPVIQEKLNISTQILQNHHIHNLEPIHINSTMPLQGIETIKVQVQPPLQQLTQVVVSAPQIDVSESLLMCQPTLMFDPSQVIPVSTHTLPHHFVHTHNIHNPQGHYL